MEFITATKNGVETILDDVLLPERVIASTMTVTDKFVAKTDSFLVKITRTDYR